MLTDSDRLEMLKSLGAEKFDTGKTDRLWAVFEGEFNAPELSGIGVEGEVTWLECRLSDKDTHELVKGSPLTRIGTGVQYTVKRLEPSRSSGFLVIRLSK